MADNLFKRSIAVIKANQAASGAFIASPSFAQYQYSWFRDGSYIAYAMDLVGERESSRRFYDWAAAAVLARADVVARATTRAAGGEPPAPADILHTRYNLDGTVSDDDWPNFQLDGFGTLLWGMSEHIRRWGDQAADSWQQAARLVASYLAALWRQPCYDCWEEFGDKVHIATLAAVYGGLNAAADLLGTDEPRHSAAAIHRFVLDEGVTDGRLCKFIGSRLVDGSLIHAATPYRLLAPDDPLMVATVARIERDLVRDGGVHRYSEDSYYGGGQWILLSAYLGWHYLERGEVAAAQRLLDWIEGATCADGLLPEQVARHLNYPQMLPIWQERWGHSACPLLWSHAAYLTLASHLSRYLNRIDYAHD